MIQNYKMVLASGSPRRKELFEMTGLEFEIITSNAEEKQEGETPAEIVRNIAMQKVSAVADSLDAPVPTLVIGADTIVVRDDDILGKPKDEADARKMLLSLRARTHKVFTGVCVIEAGKKEPVLSFSDETLVEFSDYTDEQLEEYIRSGEPLDKAGSYAIQGFGSFLVNGIQGDYHNVMGFPIGRFLREAFMRGWIAPDPDHL